MSANDLLTILLQGSYILIFAMTFVDFLRHKDRRRRDITLMFASLTLLFVIQTITRLTGVQARWLSLLGLIALVSQPYLLLRLIKYFQPAPTTVMRVVGISMVVSWMAFLLADAFAPSAAQVALLAILAYFIFTNAYAMLVFVRGSLTTAGVVRQRLRFAAGGSGLLALTMIFLILIAIIPGARELFTTLTLLVGAASGLSYFIGFASSRWLRRVWQLMEVWDYLPHLITKPTAEYTNVSGIIQQLCLTTTQAVGGLATVAIHKSAVSDGWSLYQPSALPAIADNLTATQPSIENAWKERKPHILSTSAPISNEERQLLDQAGAQTLLIVPIATPERAWGLLLAFLRYSSLFLDDDLGLLVLLTNQTALVIENSALVEELQAHNRNLAQKSAQLTAANKELEAFSYSVSHDLRAPLRAINGFARIILEDYGDQLAADMRRYLMVISDNARQMGELIDDLLTFSRLSRQPLRTEAVAMKPLVERVYQELCINEVSRNIDITIGDLPVCEVDPTLMKQVFANLLANALKYTNKRGVTKIEVNCQEQTNGYIFFVKDNGVGFDMRYIDKLFNVFQRLHAAEDYEGTGVGLAIVQRIIQRHGGTVWAEGEVDKGASFYFTIIEKEERYVDASRNTIS